MSNSMNPTPPTNNQGPLCDGAWAIPPSPLMLTHGNNYHTCSKCSEPCESPAETVVSDNQGPDELDRILLGIQNWVSSQHIYTNDGSYRLDPAEAKQAILRLKATWERQAENYGRTAGLADLLTWLSLHDIEDVTMVQDYVNHVTRSIAQFPNQPHVIHAELEQPNQEQRKT